MALTTKSGFLFGYEVTDTNRYLDFANVAAGTQLTATLRVGYYCLDGLMAEVDRALQAVDAVNAYTVSANRTLAGGTQNRITIASTGALELRFGTGTNALLSCAALLGFNASDYTGASSYTGANSTGTYLFPAKIGYSYQPFQTLRMNQGVVNVAASGIKETLVFSTQEFFQIEFKYEPEASAIASWSDFLTWASKGIEVEFWDDVADPATYVRVTLEKTEQEGKGLGFLMREMLPDFPFFYRTGIMQFRKVVL